LLCYLLYDGISGKGHQVVATHDVYVSSIAPAGAPRVLGYPDIEAARVGREAHKGHRVIRTLALGVVVQTARVAHKARRGTNLKKSNKNVFSKISALNGGQKRLPATATGPLFATICVSKIKVVLV
jgi:hypothetical protein